VRSVPGRVKEGYIFEIWPNRTPDHEAPILEVRGVEEKAS